MAQWVWSLCAYILRTAEPYSCLRLRSQSQHNRVLKRKADVSKASHTQEFFRYVFILTDHFNVLNPDPDEI